MKKSVKELCIKNVSCYKGFTDCSRYLLFDKQITGQKAILIQTRGGIYSTGPMAEFEFGDKFFRKALGFLGIEVMDSIIAEGMDHFPKMAGEIMAAAKERAVDAAKEMAAKTVKV